MRPILWWTAVIVCAAFYVSGTSGCADSGHPNSPSQDALVVLADTTFMADIVRNVAGDRADVTALMPMGADPHSFEPTPQDAKRIAESSAVIINIVGLAPRLDDLLTAVGDVDLMVIEAAAGLPGVSEDPHSWLDPLMVVGYVKNIVAGLSTLDAEGADTYRANGADYERTLQELDTWIRQRVETVPVERRLLVTDHESLGYFAGRYGFQIVGAVFPTTAGEGSPSAQQVAALIDKIKTSGAPAIFLEAGSNVDLARQIAGETGAEVVADLYVASLGQKAPSYVDMMRWNVERIVEALR